MNETDAGSVMGQSLIERTWPQMIVAVAAPSVALSVMGVGPLIVLIVMVSLISQTILGAAVWSRLCRRSECSLSELVGMGLVIGGVTFVAASQSMRVLSSGVAGPLLLTAPFLVLVFSSVRSDLRRVGRASVDDRAGLASSVILGALVAIPVLARITREVPLRWSGLHWFHEDVLYSETMIALTAESGASSTPSLLGSALSYHWLGAAWIGGMTRLVEVEPLIAAARVAPIVSLIALATLSWSLAGSVGGGRVARILVVSAMCGGSFVGLRDPWGSQLVVESTTQMVTTPWLLGALLVVVKTLRGDLASVPSTLMLGALGFFLAGGKLNHAAVLASGLLLAVAMAMFRDRVLARRVIPAATAFTLGVIVAYFLLYLRPGGAVMGGSLTLGFRRTVAHIWGVIPWPQGTIGAAIGGVAVVVAVAPFLLGALVSGHDGRALENRLFLRPLFVGCTTSGVFALYALSDDGGTFWFGYSIAAVCCAGGAIVLGRTEIEARPSALLWSAPAIGVAAAIGSFVVAHVGTRFVGSMSWFAPIAFPAAVAFGVLVARKPLLPIAGSPHIRWWIAPSVIALLVGTVAYSTMINLQHAVREAQPEYMVPSRAVDADLLDAGIWLGRSASRADALASNRICSNSENSFPDCTSRWFVPSAFSGMPVLVQGVSYAGSDSSLWEDRVRMNEALSLRFESGARDAAWELGVRWLWLERMAGPVDGWDQIGELAYENSAVVIVKLHSPERSFGS
jgi:hypothetical protein